MERRIANALAALVGCLALTASCFAATTMPRYYLHNAVLDSNGVIAPWYSGLNGQLDLRIRVAAETMKRYPWADTTRAVAAGPEYMYNGQWAITPTGTITVNPATLPDWDYGDVGQRGYIVIDGLVDYYRYSGDPMAIAHIACYADFMLDHCQTNASHPWPNFLISVPLRGEPYGKADPAGLIQLDMTAGVGNGLIKAYQLTGNARYFDTAKHWGDLFAAKCNFTPGAAPWGRYANPENIPTNGGWWGDSPNKLTGGISMILRFLDRLIEAGYTGNDNAIVRARDAGRAYLKDTLLPAWMVNDTWGRHYWDFVHDLRGMVSMNDAAQYMMDNKDLFPNWRNDVRNISTLFLNACSVYPEANSDVFSGAWQIPESAVCCGRSLCYGSLTLAVALSRYGVEAQNEWASEIARRMAILSTYEVNDAGYGEDLIDGGAYVYATWFIATHPLYLARGMSLLSYRPDLYSAARENHIARSSSVVTSVRYGDGRIEYCTADAPANSVDVLRTAFDPLSVSAGGVSLARQPITSGNGYTAQALPNGDFIVTVRHDGATQVAIEGNDTQQIADDQGGLTFTGTWTRISNEQDHEGGCRVSNQAGSAMTLAFTGNQVRVIGPVQQDGGLADVYIDGVKQLAGFDCWTPFSTRRQEVLYQKNGLSNSQHTLRVVVKGTKNPRSSGSKVHVDAVQWSSATGDNGFGEGGGPTDTQRMVFGYTGRGDVVDSAGNAWRPGCEFSVRVSGFNVDVIPAAWWSSPAGGDIANTADDDLYRYGVHGPKFWVDVTVAPTGPYYAKLKFAASRGLDSTKNLVSVVINGRQVVKRMDVEATAGGKDRAVDLAFNDITPQNGIIDIQFIGGDTDKGLVGEAYVQAIEVGQGSVLGNVETPTFSPDGGSFDTATSVAIACGTPGAVIHYTTNGAKPTEASQVYVGPINVDCDLTIRARAYSPGYAPSTVNSTSFKIGPRSEIMLVACYDTGKVEKFSLDGEYLGTFAARSGCIGVIQGGDGNVYVGGNNGVSKYRLDGTLIKSDLIKNSSTTQVTDLAWHAGKLWLCDWSGHAGAYDPVTGAQSGPSTTIANNPYGIKFGPDGLAYLVTFTGGQLLSWNTANGAKTPVATMGANLASLCWAGSDLYIDANHSVIYKRQAGGEIVEWGYGNNSGIGITTFDGKLYRVAANPSEFKILSLVDASTLFSGPCSTSGQAQQLCVLHLPVTSRPISEAKNFASGATIGIGPVSVTAVFADSFYVEDIHRMNGIQIRATADKPAVDALVTIRGVIKTDAATGERYIDATFIQLHGS